MIRRVAVEVSPNVYIHPSCDPDYVRETIFHDLKAKSLTDKELESFKKTLVDNIVSMFFMPSLGNMLIAVLKEIDRRSNEGKAGCYTLRIAEYNDEKEK